MFVLPLYKINFAIFTFHQVWEYFYFIKGQHSIAVDFRWRLHWSLQKLPEHTEASERQDFPSQEHLFCPPSAFPAWPTYSYPVREVCRPPGTLPAGAQQQQQRTAGSRASSKTFQGSTSSPIPLQADVGRGGATGTPLLGWRWNCEHTSSVYFLHNLEYRYWFMTAGRVLRCVVCGLIYKTGQKKRPSVFLWLDNEWVNAGGP